ncbi:M23 family metallopeptidase [Sphingomonas jaspsi]|uniref:M23 family metallopeptidase n=1 Tax=Sphingomonas jaspsi TaxID=392409 RepID=UPI0004B96F0D|nr:M23 family metallopeptidase [Sphingomonas jaspsi]
MHPLDQLGSFGGGAGVAARPFGQLRAGERQAATFGRAKQPFSLVVDLNEDMFSRTWWRGFGTLTAIVVALALTAPIGWEPLPSTNPEKISVEEAEQFRDLAISPAADGARMGGQMTANSHVEPVAVAPERARLELFARLGEGDSLDRLLVRNGATYVDAATASRLVAGAGGQIAPGTSIAIVLGRRGADGKRPLEKVRMRAGLDKVATVAAGAAGLALQIESIAVDRTPVRVRGRAGDGLYWALRASGVEPAAAAEYLRALAGQVDVGTIAPSDHFDLIFANRRAATGESQAGPLLYAALERAGQKPVRMMKWQVGGRIDWVDADGGGQQVAAFAWPVNARITSGFGMRYHPILHFARMHKGIDFGAAWGTPIVAAADGRVTLAGWAGGYGRQVRIAHGGDLATSYSHMSRLVVEPGAFVHQGQLIGYSGSSGLSTGPHLHYEVYRGGVAVNPMGVKFASRSALEGANLGAFKARLAELMAIGGKSRS